MSIFAKELGIKSIVFTSNKDVINYCEKWNINTKPLLHVNKYGMPILHNMIETARNDYPSDFVIYINSDILINPYLFSAIYSISSKLGPNVYQ